MLWISCHNSTQTLLQWELPSYTLVINYLFINLSPLTLIIAVVTKKTRLEADRHFKFIFWCSDVIYNSSAGVKMRACGWRCEVHSPDAGWFLSSLQNEIIYSQVCQVTVSHQCSVPFSLSSWSVPSLPPPPSGEVTVPSRTALLYLNKAGPKQHQEKLQVLQVFFVKLLMFSSGIFVINIVIYYC